MTMIMMIIIISTEVYFPLVFTIKPVYSLIALDVTGGHVGEKNNSKAIWDCCIVLSFWHQDGRLIPWYFIRRNPLVNYYRWQQLNFPKTLSFREISQNVKYQDRDKRDYEIH